MPLLGLNVMGQGRNKKLKSPQTAIHAMPAAEAGTAELWPVPLCRAGLS